jgi:hypothetical protein
MGALSAKEKDAMFKEFIRAKNLYVIKMQESAQNEKNRLKAEEMVRKQERRDLLAQ